MAGKRKRVKGGDANDGGGGGDAEKGTGGGGYEKMREQRIRENRERMQRLGLFDLSLKFKPGRPKRVQPILVSEKQKKKTEASTPGSESPRRSSRIKTLNPVCYSEIQKARKSKSSKNAEIRLREGSQPEIYSEEHEKLLGDCKTPWALFVDGFNENGKRIYDQINGETCHQCRQKTLGCHTRCSECNMGQGQFCGDCLYMRYGENVVEAMQNPEWACPVCRGICNCSFCRQGKGWAPTGALYRKVIKLGFKSVAHYLIQTRRFEQHCSKNPASEVKTPSESLQE